MRAIAVVFAVLPLAVAINSNSYAQSGNRLLEEIVITATKRETTLQDTAMAVSAFTAADLQQGLINNNMDIQMAVPNMLMSKGFFTSATVNIRGIGNLAVGNSSDAGTGIHQNGVYLNNSRIFETEYYDTERVEVLRGPQGTLYGRNTTAGVINVITKKPEEEFGGFIDASYGDYSYMRTRGAVNVPLTEDLWTRFSFYYSKRDGYVDNVFDGNEIDDRDLYSIRSSTTWNIGDSTDMTLVAQYFEEDDNRMRGSNSFCAKDPAGVLGCLPNKGKPKSTSNTAGTVGGFLTGTVSAITGLPFPADDNASSLRPTDERKVNFDFTPQYETDETIVSLEINHGFDNGLTLHSLSAYQSAKVDARNDYDFTTTGEFWPITTTYQRGPDGPSTVNQLQQNDRSFSDSDQWSQEFRLNSDFDGDWNFMAGVFYLDYEDENHFYVYSSALSLFGQTLGIPEDQWLYDNATDPFELETSAFFGELYYDLSDDTELTFGIRYTDEKKKARQRSIYLNFLNDPGAPGGGWASYEDDWQETTGKFNINHHWDEDIMLFATVARSYKGGGFNPISDESPLLDPAQGGNPSLSGFEPEFINSIELGAKTRLFDNTLQANVTYFYYDYEDLQVSKIINQTAINENTDADIQGFEGEFIWAPTENWNFITNLSWLDTELGTLKTFDPTDPNQQGTSDGILSTGNANVLLSCGCPGIDVDINGGDIPNAPEFTVYMAAVYSFGLDNGMNIDLSANYYWQDEFYARVYNTDDDLLDSWDVWNASATLTSADESWYAEAWIRNLTDEENQTGQYTQDAAVGLYRVYQLLEPRTYGLTAGYRF